MLDPFSVLSSLSHAPQNNSLPSNELQFLLCYDHNMAVVIM